VDGSFCRAHPGITSNVNSRLSRWLFYAERRRGNRRGRCMPALQFVEPPYGPRRLTRLESTAPQVLLNAENLQLDVGYV